MAQAITVEEAVEAITSGGGVVSPTVEGQLLKYIGAATAAVEDLAGPLVADTRTATFRGGSVAYSLPVAPVSDVSVEVDGATVTAEHVDLTAGVVTLASAPSPTATVEVTYDCGYATLPDNLRLAVMEQVRFLWQSTRQGATRDAATQYTPAGYAVPYMVVGLCDPNPPAPGFA